MNKEIGFTVSGYGIQRPLRVTELKFGTSVGTVAVTDDGEFRLNDKGVKLSMFDVSDGKRERVVSQSEMHAIINAGNQMRHIIATCMNIGLDTMYATQAWDDSVHGLSHGG